MIDFLMIIFSFLMGSIPTGYLIVKKVCNEDIRNFGSGNIGATNVKRRLGKKMSNITLLLDMLKAIIPVLIAKWLIFKGLVNMDQTLLLSFVAIAAILGHNYTPFLKFKGGKGVATSAAAFIFITPKSFIVTAIVFFGMKLITKVVSIRAMVSSVTLFISTWIFAYNKNYVLATLFACVLIFWRHRANIKRIIDGTEK